MATEDQGIMSLPQGDQETSPELSLEDSHDAVMQGLENASPQASAQVQQLMQSIMPQLDQLSDEELDSFLQAIQYLYDGGEAEYAKRLQEVVSTGILDQGDLPEEFDPEVLSAIGTVLLQAKRQRQGGAEQMQEPPAKFARGGIADAARLVASRGRSGDTMLAHINADEAKLLRKHGGMGTVNPATGLPEYGLLGSIGKAFKSVTNAVKSVVKGVVNTVKQVVKSPIGRVLATVALATFLGPAGAGLMSTGAALGVASGATTLLATGDLKQALMAGATAYFGAPGGAVSNLVGQAGITNLAANAAISAGIVGTGSGLLTGQKLADAVKTGLTAGAISGLATGAAHGFTTGPNGVPTDMGPSQTQPSLGSDLDKYLAKVPPAGGGEYSEALANTPAREPLTPGQVQGQIAQGPAATAQGPSTMGPQPSGNQGLGPGFSQYETTMSKVMNTGSDMAKGIGDLYNRYLSPSGIQEAGRADALAAVQKQFPGVTTDQILNAPAGSVLAKAYSSAMPGVFSTYGPMVGAGIGIAGLAGGFKPSQVPTSQLAQTLKGTPGEDLIKANPSQYLVQGLPGVQYNQAGNIVGSTPWEPSATMADVRVPAAQRPAAGIAGLGTMYTPAANSMGQAQQIYQPYNTASMYTNLMNPRATGYAYPYFTAATGGLASLAQGGYPRRTGQISGPGTETSDSIPAMLSDGEFVMTAKAVRAAGNGSRRAGAKKMYALMHQLERNASRG